MGIDLTQIAGALISLISCVITVIIVPYIKSKAGQAKFDEMVRWASVAVDAAEKLYKNGDIEKDCRKKFVTDFLEKKGFKIDYDEIEVLLESAVKGLAKTHTEEKE